MIKYWIIFNLILIAYLFYKTWTCGDLLVEPIAVTMVYIVTNGGFLAYYRFVPSLPFLVSMVLILIAPVLTWLISDSIYRYMLNHDKFPKPPKHSTILTQSLSLRERIQGMPVAEYNDLLRDMSLQTKEWFTRWYHHPTHDDDWYTKNNQARLKRLNRYLRQSYSTKETIPN